MQGSFYGWYLKCQSKTQTLAIIPAVHKRTCSIQIITENGAWTVTFPGKMFEKRDQEIVIGENCFNERGMRLAVHTKEVSAEGKLKFGPLKRLRYDIMGPFAWMPFMECRHSVWSMHHMVWGKLRINGQVYSFQNADGYWEGDRGRSFPKEYAWTQCCFSEGSLMLSVAEIPIAGIHFTGIIGFVLWKGREYRIATYLGAKAVQIENKMIRIVQGNLILEACLLEAGGRPLRAPTKGEMVRTIHESAACSAFYRFKNETRTLFAFKTDRASFEYEYLS